jgi:hypothetical protein
MSLPAARPPDFDIVEHEPHRLREYAIGLLEHLRAIRAGEPSNGYGLGKIKAAADWLLRQYKEAGLPKPLEVDAMWEEVRRIKPPTGIEKWLRERPGEVAPALGPGARTGAPVHWRLLPAYWEAMFFDASPR